MFMYYERFIESGRHRERQTALHIPLDEIGIRMSNDHIYSFKSRYNTSTVIVSPWIKREPYRETIKW